MNTALLSHTVPFEVEYHALELCYQSLRIHSPEAKRRLLLSIYTHGLRVPITVIAAEQATRFIVIDGYLRLAVLKELKHDSVRVCLWPMRAADALIYAYVYNKARVWKPIEEAALLQELMISHQYTQHQLATLFAKSDTWVCHRLQLIQDLPVYMREAIYQGTLSSWSASRILLPFARANEIHAKAFLDYLQCHSHTTREVRDFYEHYIHSSRKIRDQMIHQPDLFFKSQSSAHDTADTLPEEQFTKKLTQAVYLLQAVKPLLPAVFYRQQSAAERHDLQKIWHRLERLMVELHQLIEELTHDPTSHERNLACPESERKKHS